MAKYKAYPEYKDSGVEWLGDIPKNWDLKKLKYLSSIQTGSKDTVDAIEGGKYPFFVRSQTIEKIDSIGANCEAVLTAGDGAGVGKIYHHYKGKFDFHQRVYMLSNFTKVNGRFVYYYLLANFYKVALEGNAKSTVDSLRLPQFLNFEFSFPDTKEQSSIVRQLDILCGYTDSLIDKAEKLIELLKEKRQAVISHAVTKGLNPNVPMKNSGIEWLGDVPCHWNVAKLKYISTLNNQTLSDSTSKNLLIKYIDIGNISKESGISNPEEMFFSEAPSRARRIVKDGDVIISTVRTYLEAIAIILNPPHNLVVSTGFAVIRPQKLSKKFSLYSFKDRKFIQKIISMSVGISYPAINASDLITIKIPFPEYLEQNEIGDFLHRKTAKIDILIEKQRQQIDLLKERRTALIAAAVTGKIDLREWMPPASSTEASLAAEEATA